MPRVRESSGMPKHTKKPIAIDADFGDVAVIDADVHPSYASKEVQRDLASRMDEPYASMLHPDRRGDAPYPDHGWPETLGGNRSSPMLRQLESHHEIKSILPAANAMVPMPAAGPRLSGNHLTAVFTETV